MGDDEEVERKPHKANLEDEFLKNPYSGASFRNPFLNKNRPGNRSLPIILQAEEFRFNTLDEATSEWKCISLSEASLRQMATKTGPGCRSPLQRAALQRLNDLPSGYEFVVSLRKSTFVPPRVRRRVEMKTTSGVIVEKLNIEVTDQGSSLRVEAVNEGLVAVWNRSFPGFQIRTGDHIIRIGLSRSAPESRGRACSQAGANLTAGNASSLVDELNNAADILRLSVRRPPPGQAQRMPSRVPTES
jgi:hypothetical protein